MENREIKIMVGSTVYGFEDQLSAIVSLLMTMVQKTVDIHPPKTVISVHYNAPQISDQRLK